MNFRKTLIAISVSTLSAAIVAAPAVAPANRIRIWEGSAVSFPDSQYTIGSTTAIGTVKTLKINSTVTNLLLNMNIAANAGGLNMTGKYPSAVQFDGSSHQRLSESGYPYVGQCVAFAKAMTGATATTTWYRGRALSDYVSWNGVGYYLNNSPFNPIFQQGTMIAHFGSIGVNSAYSANTTNPHVAIFMSWSYNSQGYIDGINVVDQNLIPNISGNTGSATGLIQKHKLPWNSGSNLLVFSSKNYHIVDIR